MANTIKLKRGSGSDPGTSDLSVGELAIRTDTALLFTKNDGGSVVPIGISDGDKGDITVSSNGGTFTIDNDAVTTAKIVDGAVTAAKIASQTITADKIANDAVNTGELADGSVTAAKIATNVITADKIASGAVATSELATDAVTGAKIADDSIDSEHYVDGSIDTAHIADGQITNAKIATGTISASRITSGGLTSSVIANDAIITDKIADDAVTYAKIQNVTQDRILGRQSSGTGVVEELNAANVRLMINVEDGATADQSASEIVALIADQTIAPSTIDMEDSEQIKLGNGDDLTLVHDGSNSTIDSNTGTLIIRSDGGGLKLLSEGNIILRDNDDTTNLIRCINGGQIELYHAGSKKAETVSGGFTVTGTCTATAFSGDGSSLTGISAGATGGGSDEIFYENGQNVTTDYTITNGKNAMSAGPITIDSGVTVTVGAGETLTIV